MSLREVEPNPESPPSIPAKPGPKPSVISRGNLLRWLKFTQKYSAYGVLVFAGLHLTSTVVLPPFSMPAANSAFMVARDVYQSAMGENLLVYGAFGIHIISGLILRAVRMASQYSDFGKIGLARPSRIAYSGLVLSVLTFMHFVALRVGPVKALGDSSLISLDYITFALSKNAFKVTTGLGLLASVFGFHSLEGMNQYLRLKLRPITRYVTLAVIVALAFKSISVLGAEPAPTGWLADQYTMAETAAENIIG